LFITNPPDDKNALKRKKGDRAKGTCEWILETDEFMHWLKAPRNEGPNEPGILWLYGHPGTGKSTMAVTMADKLPDQPFFAEGNNVLAYFFCDSSSEKQRTAISILRGLVYHLVKQCPMLMKHLLPKYLERRESIYISFDALWNVFMEMGRDTTVGIYCIIDALDECELDSQQMLLRQIHQSFQTQETADSTPPRTRILITSRPYHEIGEYLFYFKNKDLASYRAVREDLRTMIQEKVQDIAERKKFPERVTEQVTRILEEKAEGTFLWVGIACGELAQPGVQSRNAVKTLAKMPPGLYALYKQLLNAALRNGDESDGESRTVLDVLKFVAFARRRLTVLELAALCQLYPEYDEDVRLQFTKDLIDSCRLMIVIQDGRVQLLHKSVKDFLVDKRQEVNDLHAHAELADQCINHVLAESELPDPKMRSNAFLNYAVEYWPEHAGIAGNKFEIRPHHAPFFEHGSLRWKLWLQRFNSLRYDFQKLEEGFCIFHAAARWGIAPLISWALTQAVRGPGLTYGYDKRSYRDEDFLTETGKTPLEEAAMQGSTGVMRILLESLRDESEISNRAIIAAARNEDNGRKLMELLLNRRGDQIQITPDVVEAAAGNYGCGKDIMLLLLDRRGDQIHITKDVVEAAAENHESGKEIILLILDRRGDQIQFTEDAISTIMRRFDSTLVALLLDRQGHRIQITEQMVNAAAASCESGKEIMLLLLDW
jgi:hypothetical protein